MEERKKNDWFFDPTPDNCEEAKNELAAKKAYPDEKKNKESTKSRIKYLKWWIQENCS